MVWFHSFAYGYTVFPPFTEKDNSLSIVFSWHPCQLLLYHTYMYVFLTGLSILSHWFMCLFFFSPNTMLLWLLWLCNIICNQEVWCLQICSFFSAILWLVQGLLWLYANCRIIFFYLCEKCYYNYDRDWFESIDCFVW